MKNNFRARSHPAWWAFAVHRLSGVLLALFLHRESDRRTHSGS